MKPAPLPKSAIETFDYSFGAADGCTNNCPYCYAKGIVERFGTRAGQQKPNFHEFRFHPDKLNRLASSPNHKKYFVMPLGDAFCGEKLIDGKHYSGFPISFRRNICRAIAENPLKTFYWQTKSPKNITQRDVEAIPEYNCTMGTSVTSEKDVHRLARLIDKFSRTRHKFFVHFEPLFGEVFTDSTAYHLHEKSLIGHALQSGRFDWIIVGPQTNPIKQPPAAAVEQIREIARAHGIPLWEKNALVVEGRDRIQEMPEKKEEI
jgi:protein gp37